MSWVVRTSTNRFCYQAIFLSKSSTFHGCVSRVNLLIGQYRFVWLLIKRLSLFLPLIFFPSGTSNLLLWRLIYLLLVTRVRVSGWNLIEAISMTLNFSIRSARWSCVHELSYNSFPIKNRWNFMYICTVTIFRQMNLYFVGTVVALNLQMTRTTHIW